MDGIIRHTPLPLQSGTRLGVYEILATIGAGGMGEVYRARDTQLKREVAIKVLPDPFAQDADRLARFQREADLLATLNHPNIAAVYGLEKSDGSTGISPRVGRTSRARTRRRRRRRWSSSSTGAKS